MQFGQATITDVVGTPLFMLAVLLFAWFLAGWIPSPRGRRSFMILITGLAIIATLLAEAGIIWLGWTPPWKETGIVSLSPSLLDLIVLPAVAVLILGVWLIGSLAGMLPADKRFEFSAGRAALLGLACLLYEIGMLWLGWPAPWNLPIPSE